MKNIEELINWIANTDKEIVIEVYGKGACYFDVTCEVIDGCICLSGVHNATLEREYLFNKPVTELCTEITLPENLSKEMPSLECKKYYILYGETAMPEVQPFIMVNHTNLADLLVLTHYEKQFTLPLTIPESFHLI